MFSKLWLINIILAVLAIFFGIRAYGVWSKGDQSAIEIPRSAKSRKLLEKRTPKHKMPPESAYGVVVDRILFCPEREEFIPEEPEPEPEVKTVKVSGKKIVLYGVILTDNCRVALINNPLKQLGERKDKWVRIQDTIGQLTVKDIQSDRLILADGADQFEVPLYDKDKPKRRVTSAKQIKPKVVTTGSKPKTTRPKTSQISRKEKIRKEKIDDSEYEVIETPFGKVKRRKK